MDRVIRMKKCSCIWHFDSPLKGSCSCCCRPCFAGAAFSSFASLFVEWRWQMKLWVLQWAGLSLHLFQPTSTPSLSQPSCVLAQQGSNAVPDLTQCSWHCPFGNACGTVGKEPGDREKPPCYPITVLNSQRGSQLIAGANPLPSSCCGAGIWG